MRHHGAPNLALSWTVNSDRWNQQSMQNNYLLSVPPPVLLGVAGVVLGNEPMSNVYWSARFDIDIPGLVLEELSVLLYPWLPSFRVAVSKITRPGMVSPAGCLAADTAGCASGCRCRQRKHGQPGPTHPWRCGPKALCYSQRAWDDAEGE